MSRGGTDDGTARNRETYDRIATRYADNQRATHVPDAPWLDQGMAAAFLAALPRRALVADVGCGPARDGARLAAAGHTVVGVDLSAGMLALAAVALGGRVAQGDLRALPLADGRLDGVWCCAALLHVPEEATPTVLRELRRVLRPGGTLGLVTAIGEGSVVEPVAYAPGEQRWFVYRRPERVLHELRAAGLRPVRQNRVAGHRQWLTVVADA